MEEATMVFFKKSLKILCIVGLLLLLPGCYNSKQANVVAAAVMARQAAVKTEPSSWLVYWDLDEGTKELDKVGGRLESLSFFAAYFDIDKKVFVPKELCEKRAKLKKQDKYIEYLTIVNDQLRSRNSSSVKDTQILKSILGTDEVMDRHIAEIIDLAKAGNFDGLEIDYERVWKDETTKKLFVKFIERLYRTTQAQNLKLRVILEPSTPFSTTQFIAGPEYVVMFYNLYGTHTFLPGPKADRAFIQKTLANMSNLPEPKVVAYAGGGCLWNTKGQRRLITEKEALAIMKKHNSQPIRDAESQCLVFKYREGIVFNYVWFADATTMNYWISLAKEDGIKNIALWRLGGNPSIKEIK